MLSAYLSETIENRKFSDCQVTTIEYVGLNSSIFRRLHDNIKTWFTKIYNNLASRIGSKEHTCKSFCSGVPVSIRRCLEFLATDIKFFHLKLFLSFSAWASSIRTQLHFQCLRILRSSFCCKLKNDFQIFNGNRNSTGSQFYEDKPLEYKPVAFKKRIAHKKNIKWRWPPSLSQRI